MFFLGQLSRAPPLAPACLMPIAIGSALAAGCLVRRVSAARFCATTTLLVGLELTWDALASIA
jgi:hypothetical protein